MKSKKFVLTTLLVISFFTRAQSQSGYYDVPTYATNSYWSNWFVGAGFGSLVYFGDGDFSSAFLGLVSPALNISLGKWITPSVAMRFEYSGLQARGYTTDGSHSSAGEYVLSDNIYRQQWGLMSLHADALFNVANLFDGYSPDRVYNPIPYAGFGFVHNSTANCQEFAFTAGLLNSFKISDSFDMNLDLKATMAKGNMDGEFGLPVEGFLSLTIGATYRFKPRGWRREGAVIPSEIIVGERDTLDLNPKNQIKELTQKVENAKKRNRELQDKLTAAEKALAEKPKVEIVREGVISTSVIFFKIGSTKLSKENMVHLNYISDVIHADNSGRVYSIVGYADRVTGTKEQNEKVSRERAEAVYKALVNDFFVDATKLSMEYRGGVESMFYKDPTLNRVVIIE